MCYVYHTVLWYRKNKALNANLNELEAQLYGFATLTVKVNTQQLSVETGRPLIDNVILKRLLL